MNSPASVLKIVIESGRLVGPFIVNNYLLNFEEWAKRDNFHLTA